MARAVETQHGADRRLDGPDGMQQVQVGEGDDVGGHRQRQQQRPGQDSAGGKLVRGHQPCGARAKQGHDDAHTGQQHDGIGEGLRQHIAGQVVPMFQAAAQRPPAQRQDRRKHRQRDQGRANEPAGSAFRPA
ncbi:hypothetical protein D3C73_1277950 [compost metagenome]